MEGIQKIITISQNDVDKYADLTGDYNPIHFDKEFAATTNFKKPIVHGPLLLIKSTTFFANDFPGPGTVYLSHDYKFLKPVYVDENLFIEINLMSQNEKGHLFVSTKCYNDERHLLFDGVARLKKY